MRKGWTLQPFFLSLGMEIKVTIKQAEEAIIGYTDSSLARSETNDCVVRALAAATGVSYDDAHQYTADKFNRKNKQGTFGFVPKLDALKREGTVLGKAFTKIGDPMYSTISNPDMIQPFTYYKVYGEIVKREMTFKSFVKKYPKGTYLLVVARHAFTIKDGVVIGGNYNDTTQLRKRINAAYRVDS